MLDDAGISFDKYRYDMNIDRPPLEIRLPTNQPGCHGLVATQTRQGDAEGLLVITRAMTSINSRKEGDRLARQLWLN